MTEVLERRSTRTTTCHNCGEDFECPRQAGSAPRHCPDCEADPAVDTSLSRCLCCKVRLGMRAYIPEGKMGRRPTVCLACISQHEGPSKKICRGCGGIHDLSEFYTNSRSGDGIDPACKCCRRFCMIESVYDISRVGHAELEGWQDGRCAICLLPPEECNQRGKDGKVKNLAVEHDHATLRVRGLACDGHNQVFGNLFDSVILAVRNVIYLHFGGVTGMPTPVREAFLASLESWLTETVLEAVRALGEVVQNFFPHEIEASEA